MGTQAKYYQLKESKVQYALSQLSNDEDFYNTIKNSEYILDSIDSDTSSKSLPEVIAKATSNIELSQLAIFGTKIETQFNSESEIQYISKEDVQRIDELLKSLNIVSKDEFIIAYNESQDAPYDETIYKDLFNFYWIHFNSFREFYSKCKIANSSILVRIG